MKDREGSMKEKGGIENGIEEVMMEGEIGEERKRIEGVKRKEAKRKRRWMGKLKKM